MKKINILLLILIPIFLFGLNAFLVFPLFQGEYDRNTGSIGIAHILNARYIARFLLYGWNPFWYGGFPNHLIYPLLAPITLALIQKILPFLSMPQVYRITVASAYCLIPVGIFFLTRYLTKKTIPGILAALIYIFAPSANYFLIPGFRSIGEVVNFAPWQLSVITDYGEGPHIIDLAIVPFAVIAYCKLLREPTFYKFLLTAALLAIVVSINLFSAYALAYFLLGIFIAEVLLGHFKQKFLISLLLVPVIYGLMAYCYDLSMLKSLAASGYIHPENVFRLPPITNIFLILIFGLAPLAFIFYEIFKNKPKIQNGLISGLWFFFFWAIPYAFYKGVWFGSQPNRYMPELNLVAAMILAIIMGKMIDFIKEKSGKWGYLTGGMILAFTLGAIFYISLGFIQNPEPLTTAHPDFKTTSEYKIAKWLGENTSYEKGERAYLTGSPGFFLNEFADVPQIRGDEDNAQSDPWWADITYQVNKGTDGELAVGWLTALNVRYLVVDHGAVTPFHDYNYPDKFSFLPVATEINGFKIYDNFEAGEIISAVDLAKINRLKPLNHKVKLVLDKEGLLNYLQAIKEPAPGEIKYDYQYRKNPDLAVVKVTKATKNLGILFKSTYDRGWQADWQQGQKEGRAIIGKIGPDMMLIKPEISGDYTLKITYHRPVFEYLGYLTTVITIIILLLLIIKKGNFKIDFAPKEEIHKDDEID